MKKKTILVLDEVTNYVEVLRHQKNIFGEDVEFIFEKVQTFTKQFENINITINQ